MKQFFPLLFFTVFIGIIAAASIYLARRFNFYFSIENTKILFFAFPVLSVGLAMIYSIDNGYTKKVLAPKDILSLSDI